MASLYRRGRRAGVALLGGVVLLFGIIAIPYPGPGWLIVFAGLGILATEFDWAKRVLNYARTRYDAWQEWLRRQPLYIKIGFWFFTLLVVVVTIWLLNGYGIINGLLRLDIDWLNSPLIG
jgi:uncharacterized protein (TIGR02611 family)